MKAIFLNISAWIMLPFMDAIAKYLSSELPFFKLLGQDIFLLFICSSIYVIFLKINLNGQKIQNYNFIEG